MVHVQPGLALAALALFVPQLVFVPLMQHAINRRTGARVWLLRQISGGAVAFITGVTRLNDPWGDLVYHFRDMRNTHVKFRLVAGAAN